LNCILAQRLVKVEDGSRVVAVEVLVNTPYISKLIRGGEFNEIKAIMEKGNETGMTTFDQSLFKLFKAGKIDLKTTLVNADSSSNLEWKINFGGGEKDVSGKSEEMEELKLPGSSAK